MKFGNTGGWNVITSSELSDDGKARMEKTLATTEGVTAIKGGQKAFSGKNEELKNERFDGDANNYTYTTGESSNMVLNENIVTGDENTMRTESKSSSVSHSSKVFKSSNNNDATDHHQTNTQNFEQTKLSQDPTVVQEAFRLAQQPGKILSRNIERASDTQNMITEKKELADGTIVTTRRYEPINSNHTDIQATKTTNNSNVSNKSTKSVESSSSKTITSTTSNRDEEAFRLSQQPGNIISRDVSMADNNTRMITEKKELADGTIVTTKRFEKISSATSGDSANSEIQTKISSTNQQVKTSTSQRDEEAFRLAQQPGKIISRDISMANPTTRMIVEKKELTDGTIVTTKRYESVSDGGDIKSVKSNNVDEFAKSLRSDSHSVTNVVKNESNRTVNSTTNTTSRDEEAFKLAQQPGTIISRDVTMTNPSTRMIVEKKELTDGTIVTTKRFENINENVETVKKVTQNFDTRKITNNNDVNTQREAVEETMVKKIFDTSCQCPENMHDHKTKDFIKNERRNEQYNIDSEIISNKEIKKEVKKVDQEKKVVEEQRITRELENDSAHKAFASSLRCVTPPLDKTSTIRVDRRSPSRETTSSKYSTSTTTIKRNSNVDIRKNEDFMRSTQSSDRRTSKSPEKQVKKVTEVPQKFTDSPNKSDVRKPVASKITDHQVREPSPVKNNSRPTSPQKQSTPSRPKKQSQNVINKRTECDELLTSTIKIDNIDKTINDLKIIQTIDTKDLSATTSVSDLEYISASDHKRMITDLDTENDIQVKINIENANQLDDLQIKTTVSEVEPKSNKKPFNRSETFEERAKKLIGMKSDDETITSTTPITTVKKEPLNVPNYAKPTKASQAPTISKDTINRVSEIRERKAKIEEIEKTVKKNSSINEFMKYETACECDHDTPSSPERSPTRKNNSTKQITQRITSPEKKKTINEINKITKTAKITKEEKRRSRSPTRTPETHITVAQITISPSRGITSKTVTKTSTVDSNKTLKVAPSIKLVKLTSDISSTEPDSETDHDLIKNIDKSSGKNIRKKLIQTRKDSAPVTRSTSTNEKEKVSRSISENIIKIDTTKKSASTRESPKKDSKRPTKCITTKTINLKNVNDSTTLNSTTLDNVEVDITVQQAKSSREPSPNKIVPIPIHTDEEINEEETLHPHMVTEPDDEKRKIKSKVINVPIFQEETKQFVGLEITEVSTEKGQTILEEDESVEESHLINSSSLERADRKRNSIQIDAIEEDESLLSVSQKVSKFNETVEELKKPSKTSAKIDNNYVKLEDASDNEEFLSVNEKVTKFTKATDEKTTKKTENVMTRSIDETIDENLKNDECLLSVTDKVNKFIASAERLSSPVPQRSPELVKNAMKHNVKSKVDNLTESFLGHERKSVSVERDTTKTSEISLKSTEAIKKAREVFESNSTATKELNRQNDILSRPSVFEAKRTQKIERKNSKEINTKREEKSPDRRSPSKTPSPTPRRGSGDRTPIYMKDQVSTKKDLFEKRISSSKIENENFYHQKSLSPQNSVEEKRRRSSTDDTHVQQVTRKISSSDKHYMQHTVASLEHVANTEAREAELHRTSKIDELEQRRESSRSPTKRPSISESIEPPKTPTKFGVELKRTESYKNSSSTSATRKVSACSESVIIEEIWDLAELEKLLEIVVGYEQRRRIRAQIRLVKKKIEDKKMSMEIKSSRKSSSSTTYYSSPSRTTQQQITTKTDKPREASKAITTTTTTTTRYSSASDKSPVVTSSRSTKVTTSSSPREIIESLNKNNKGKITTESVVKTVKKNTSATSNTSQRKSSSTREPKSETDCITSSYGVGPTDSNGLPLFGLKALRKKESKSK